MKLSRHHRLREGDLRKLKNESSKGYYRVNKSSFGMSIAEVDPKNLYIYERKEAVVESFHIWECTRCKETIYTGSATEPWSCPKCNSKTSKMIYKGIGRDNNRKVLIEEIKVKVKEIMEYGR